MLNKITNAGLHAASFPVNTMWVYRQFKSCLGMLDPATNTENYYVEARYYNPAR